MIRTLLGFVIGAICSAAFFVAYVIPIVRTNWHAQGFNEGHIDARVEISVKLEKEFPNRPNDCKEQRTLFEVKTTSVYVVDCPTGKQISVVQ